MIVKKKNWTSLGKYSKMLKLIKTRDFSLMDMLGVSKIPREQIFNKFMTWMYKKSLAETSPKNVFRVGLDPEEKIIKKIKFDANVSEKLERQTSRKNEETIHQKAKIDGKGGFFSI